MPTIKINLDEGKKFNLSWSQNLYLISYLKAQRLLPFVVPKEDHTQDIEVWANSLWNYGHRELNLYSSLPKDAKVLDIGCGCAVIDILASASNPSFKFFLLDKQEPFKKDEFVWFADKHVFYHSWGVVYDLIYSSGLDKQKFKFMNFDETWPEELDLITSFFSWGFHYPIENEFDYWNKVLLNLKIGGKLYLDISNNCLDQNPNTIEFISDMLGSKPLMIPYNRKSIHDLLDNKNYIWKDNTLGKGCLWVRNK